MVDRVLEQAAYLKKRGRNDDCIEWLEQHLSTWSSRSPEYWHLARELAETCLNAGEACARAGLLSPCLQYLEKAKQVTVPPEGEKWSDKVEWRVLRLRVFEKLGDYFHRYESSRSKRTC
jgi:hypothetical protein